TAKTERGRPTRVLRDRQVNPRRVARAGDLLDNRATGITKPEHFRDLDERLARHVVACSRNEFILAFFGDEKQIRVTAGHYQSHGRIFDRRIVENNRIEMALDMIYADDGNFKAVRERLRITNADQQ